MEEREGGEEQEKEQARKQASKQSKQESIRASERETNKPHHQLRPRARLGRMGMKDGMDAELHEKHHCFSAFCSDLGFGQGGVGQLGRRDRRSGF